MIVSYDIDGVLAEQPPASEIKWGRMNGSLRKERKEFLYDWYEHARPLLMPSEEKFYAISARKLDPRNYTITKNWLEKYHSNKVIDFYLLNESRSVENVVNFKSRTVLELGIQRHYEDNKKVLKGMSKILPSSVELYFWEVGMIQPIPFTSRA